MPLGRITYMYIEMLFVGITGSCGPKKPLLEGMYICTTWQTQLNDLCAMVMRPYVILL